MGKKKGKGKGGKKGKAVDLTEPGFQPASLADRYKTVHRAMGLDPELLERNAGILHEALEPTEDVPCFTTLRLSNLHFGPGATHGFAAALLGVGPGLDPLDTEQILLVPPDGTVCYRQLTKLELIENRCLDRGVQALATLLTPNAVQRGLALSELTVRGDAFGAAACESLACSLSWTSPLSSLDIEYNAELDDEAVRRLCSGLSLNGSLTRLSLVYGAFGAGGAGGVSRLLYGSEFTAIQHLALRGNYLGPRGLRALCAGIAGSWTLETLDLSMTGIGRPLEVPRSKEASRSAKEEVNKAWENFIRALRSNQLSEKTVEPEDVTVLLQRRGGAGSAITDEDEDGDGDADDPASVAAAAAAAARASSPVSGDDDDAPVVSRAATDMRILKRVRDAREAAATVKARIKTIVLIENNLMPEQGEALAALFTELGPKAPLQQCTVDITLPSEIYAQVWKDGGGGGGKGGKKKKGKKKK